jgi:hypothetical protein
MVLRGRRRIRREMSDQQPPLEPPRDPLAISTTGALLGVEQVAVTPDGKVVVPVDSLAVGRKR